MEAKRLVGQFDRGVITRKELVGRLIRMAASHRPEVVSSEVPADVVHDVLVEAREISDGLAAGRSLVTWRPDTPQEAAEYRAGLAAWCGWAAKA